MRIVLTGATGFIGRALVLRLLRDGHQLTAMVRDLARGRDALGPDVALVLAGDAEALATAVATADGVVNLAGEPIVGQRWSAARKAVLTASRVGPTAALVEAIARRAVPLPVFVSASAVGYYGDSGDDEIDEGGPAGTSFAATLSAAWEAAAEAARPHAARVVLARIGVVLGREGGALAKLLPTTRALAGGPIAGGRQYVPWIHLTDTVEALVFALVTPGIDGPVNLVAPTPVPQRALAKAIGRAVHRPAIAPAPRFAMRLILGEAADVLLASQRVVPRALLAAGFRFAFPDLDEALADIVSTADVALGTVGSRLAPLPPEHAYVRARRPTHVLVSRVTLDAPLATVLPFFAAAENLNLLTPPAMGFVIQTPRPIAMAAGAVIDYRLRVMGMPIAWRTVIEAWQPSAPAPHFVDAQHRGPYRAWWHEHHFAADGDRTVMEDRVYYAAPMGPLGRIANAMIIRGQLRRIFGFRAAAIRLRFGR